MITWKSFGLSDVGRVREDNEDAFVVDDVYGVFIVADGMGGHLGGKTASHMAVRAVHERAKSMVQSARESGVDPYALESHAPLAFAMAQAVREASAKIYAMALQNPNLRRMGTTVTTVCMEGPHAVVAHVGDSRCYIWRDHTLSQVTTDHSFVQDQVRAGVMTQEEARTHHQRNVITRSVGIEPNILVDVHGLDVEPGDRLLICSDGLSNMVSDVEIAEVLESESNPEEACEALIDRALKYGGQDNVTAICLTIHGLDAGSGS